MSFSVNKLENEKQQEIKYFEPDIEIINSAICWSNIKKITLFALVIIATAMAQYLLLIPLACVCLIERMHDTRLNKRLELFRQNIGSKVSMKGGDGFLIFRWPVSVNLR